MTEYVTIKHNRGRTRGMISERVPVNLASFIIWNGGTDRIEADLALRMWRFQQVHGRGATIQELRNMIKSRIPKDCGDITAHVAQLLQNIRDLGMPVEMKVFRTRVQGLPRREFSIDGEGEWYAAA